MLETIREFASEQLAASGEMIQAERAFEAFLIGRAKSAAAGLSGPEQPEWLERLEADHDNLRAALGRALSGATQRLRYNWHHGSGSFGGCEGISARDVRGWNGRWRPGRPTRPCTPRPSTGMGQMSIDLGDHGAARNHFATSLSSYESVGDRAGVASALNGLVVVAVNRYDYDEARTLGERALRLYRELADERGVASRSTTWR